MVYSFPGQTVRVRLLLMYMVTDWGVGYIVFLLSLMDDNFIDNKGTNQFLSTFLTHENEIPKTQTQGSVQVLHHRVWGGARSEPK